MERRIASMHPRLNATYNDTTNEWEGTGGWEQVGSLLFHEAAIDLSGYSLQDMTFFPAAVGVQDPGYYSFKAGATSPYSGIIVLDIITSVPMDMATIGTDIVANIGPGMLGNIYEFETLLFGLFRLFTPNTNIALPDFQELQRTQRFDSGEPNASDKLFSYRIVRTLQTDLDDNSTVFVPASRHLVAGLFDEESELVYMQRLKRSYELANQV